MRERARARGIIDDAEAVARSRDGDLDAYAVMVARYTLPAHRTAFLLGAGEEADDAVQEAFVKAFGGSALWLRRRRPATPGR